jgi:long-chain acyl-CoA synthetase
MDGVHTVTHVGNLARLADRRLERLGDYPARWFEGRWHAAAELTDRAARFGAGLRRLGVRPGDRVAVLMTNCPEVEIAYIGIWRAGAVATPLMALAPAAELGRRLADSQAVALVTTAELAPKARAATAEKVLPTIVSGKIGEGAGTWTIPMEELEAEEPGPIADRRDEDLAALLYTGGTTGRSKGVRLTHANLYHAGKSTYAASHAAGITRALIALPLAHVYGLLLIVEGLHADEPLPTVLMPSFDPDGWLALVAEHRVQHTAVVPTMLAMLLARPLERYDLSSLHHVFSGAAPLPPRVAHEFERRVPGVRVLEGYGCTESSSIVSTTPPAATRKLGAAGVPVPGVEVRIVSDAGEDLPTGQDGEILVRGANVMAGYWHDDAQTEQVLAGGWLHTGDVGHLDGEGYLTVVDRKKDVIIRGGVNVFPRDVEDVLTQHEAVALAGVVGRPDKRLGEEVVAFVTLRPGAEATAETLTEFARGRLAANVYPREIRVVGELPLTPVGKADRKQLRALVADA